MLKPFPVPPRHSRLLATAILAAVVLGGWLLVPDGRGQAATAKMISVESLTPLLTQLKKQQDDMVANQTKIETQTAALKEELRLAKIYSARGGGSGRR